MAPGIGIEPILAESKSVVLPLHYPGSKLVLPRGIEPLSTVLQTAAMTTSAKVAFTWYLATESNCHLRYVTPRFYH